MSATAPLPANLSDAYEAARAICRHHARSFYFASHFLPRPKRDHAYAVYAFCRLLDDAADEEPSLESVERFVAVLDQIYDGRAPGVTVNGSGSRDGRALDAFAHTVRVCAIPKQYFLDLADGCRTDFTVSRYETWPQLERYCYLVAGVVGLIMCHVFDLRDPAARQQAVAMGNAMQLTNILRDIGEDFERGRLYLPREDLRRFGVTDAQLAARTRSDGFAELMRFEIARARALYTFGCRGLASLPDDGSRLTASVMASVYGGILGAIERQDYDVFRARARLSLRQKLARLPLAWKICRRETGDPDLETFQ